MNTKLLMGASALTMAALGVAGSFLPREFLVSIDIAPAGIMPAVIQLHAALLLGFAMVNWMAKDSLIGGIYNRPVAVGNLLHFASGAIALGKFVFGRAVPPFAIIAAIVYVAFAVGFAIVVFGSPVKVQS
ncbi:MAG TPA: hypothetical protein VNA69_01380 [Thermoanaerobaculia bacterium]|nr:hypothetical protein [Thermoanaerobaculia bacterium]